MYIESDQENSQVTSGVRKGSVFYSSAFVVAFSGTEQTGREQSSWLRLCFRYREGVNDTTDKMSL